MATKTEQVAIRMDAGLLERIDAHVERMQAMLPGVRMARADAIRALLLAALDGVEPARKSGAKKGGRA